MRVQVHIQGLLGAEQRNAEHKAVDTFLAVAAAATAATTATIAASAAQRPALARHVRAGFAPQLEEEVGVTLVELAQQLAD